MVQRGLGVKDARSDCFALGPFSNTRCLHDRSRPQGRAIFTVGAPLCRGWIRVETHSPLQGHFVIEFELREHDRTIDGDGEAAMTPSEHHQADDELGERMKDPA